MEKTQKYLDTSDIEALRQVAFSTKNTKLKEVCDIALSVCKCSICDRVILEARAQCVKAWNSLGTGIGNV